MVDEVGRHITFRYEGVLPLADQELLSLLDILVNKADLIEVNVIKCSIFASLGWYRMLQFEIKYSHDLNLSCHTAVVVLVPTWIVGVMLIFQV